jgi:hypothetical protein
MTMLAAMTFAALLGSISGRVTDAESGGAIAGARITIAGPGITTDSGTLVTDSDGRFQRDGLARGRYELSAAARGYVTASGQWRASITLEAAESNSEISFRLDRGAVLAGYITDDYGEPIADLTVELMATASPPSRTLRLDAVRTSVTDDRGYYRFWGLRAGHYLVAARWSATDLAAGRAGAAPAASFYPGVQARSQAEAVNVRAATEADSINFSVRSGRLARLLIQVVDANGRPPSDAGVSVAEAGGRPQVHAAFPTGARGHFVAPQMPPGDYQIVALAGLRGPAVTFAARPITINGDGAEVTVVMATADVARLSGQVAAAKDASPLPPATIAVSTEPAGQEEPRYVAAAQTTDPFSAAVSGDGRFSIPVLPGRRTIRVNGLPPGWAVQSITLNGRDVADREVVFAPGETVSNSRIALTDRLGVVTGTVANGGDGATVALFDIDRARWTPGTHAVVRASIDQRGSFRIAAVRPGEYFAAAVPREWSDRLHDAEFLSDLAQNAIRVRVHAGESLPLALTVKP